MRFLELGIVLLLIGVILTVTNAVGFAAIGSGLIWVGWICLAVGLILALMHFVSGGSWGRGRTRGA